MKRELSEEYWSGAKVSLVLQVAFFILSSLLMDGGELLQIWCFAALAYWAGFVLVMIRRPDKPPKLDLFLVRWGFPILFFFVSMPLTMLIWRARGVLH